MKTFYLLSAAIIILGCKNENQATAEKTVDAYVSYVDSLSGTPAEDAKLNWDAINKNYEFREGEVEAALTNLSDQKEALGKIDAAKAKYEELKAIIASELESESTLSNQRAFSGFEYIAIPKQIVIDSVRTTIDKRKLGLPGNFTERIFLKNSLGSTDDEGIRKLVGSVIKKTTVNGIDYYDDMARNFKIATAKIEAKKPENGIVIENRYNKTIGAGISYLIANASFQNDVAYEVLINDIYSASITDDQLDKQKIYNAYGKDADLNNYYIVMAATSTSLLYKIFEKSKKKADFAYVGVKVNGEYYKANKQVMQDWTVGTKAVPIKEILKGFQPMKNSD